MFLLLFDWFRWVIFRIFPHYCWHCCVQSGPVTVSYRWQETADSDNQLSSVRQPVQTCCDALSDYSCSSVTFLMILSHASWEIITLTAIALITLMCKVSWLSSTLCFWQFWKGCCNRPFYSEDIVILHLVKELCIIFIPFLWQKKVLIIGHGFLCANSWNVCEILMHSKSFVNWWHFIQKWRLVLTSKKYKIYNFPNDLHQNNHK